MQTSSADSYGIGQLCKYYSLRKVSFQITTFNQAGDLEDGFVMQGLDIGPDSLKAFQGSLADCKTVIWNGPMGVFEFEKFAKGTFGVAETLAGN